jgi:photosystem II stability/assembly factor-like uncharacterized protein
MVHRGEDNLKQSLAAFFLISIQSLTAGAFQFQDPLDQASEKTPLATKSAFFAAALAGQRSIVAGQRGVIVYSDSNGKSWKQSDVPVSVDLVGLSFPTARDGWAVGHGGAVLHSVDGGATWVKQLDGRVAGELAQKYYEAAPADPNNKRHQALLDQARRLGKEKETQPFIDVWFKNEKVGYVVGTFNRLFRTDDGGSHWIPMLDKIDNPDELHFFSVGGRDNDIYITGERGGVWRWDEPKGRFVAIQTPYNGSLFGLVVTPRAVIAYGMRGSVFRTVDRGAHWQALPAASAAGIVSGALCANGDIILASQAGELLVSSDDGVSFGAVATTQRLPISSVASANDGALVVAGPAGMRLVTPPKACKQK